MSRTHRDFSKIIPTAQGLMGEEAVFAWRPRHLALPWTAFRAAAQTKVVSLTRYGGPYCCDQTDMGQLPSDLWTLSFVVSCNSWPVPLVWVDGFGALILLHAGLTPPCRLSDLIVELTEARYAPCHLQRVRLWPSADSKQHEGCDITGSWIWVRVSRPHSRSIVVTLVDVRGRGIELRGDNLRLRRRHHDDHPATRFRLIAPPKGVSYFANVLTEPHGELDAETCRRLAFRATGVFGLDCFPPHQYYTRLVPVGLPLIPSLRDLVILYCRLRDDEDTRRMLDGGG